MTRRIFFIIFFLFLILNISYSQKKTAYPNVVIDGSETGKPYEIAPVQKTQNNNYQTLKDGLWEVEYTSLGINSYYDLQSNATANQIWQDPTNPLNVHACVMVLPVFGSTRFCYYLFSDDRGVTWSNFGNVAEAQSGFPSISGLSNGSAIITMHTTAGAQTPAISQNFIDLGAGFGAFIRQNPGPVNGNAQIWGRILATKNAADPTKYVLTNSQNGVVTASTTTGQSLGFTGIFSPWLNYPSENAEQYCLAIGDDGRIGNAFMSADIPGNVMFRESTNGGLSWSAPVTIFNARPADTLLAFRGISMVYLQNTPCVTFEVDHFDGTIVYPTLPSYIYFWSPTINGGVSFKIAGPDNVPFFPNTGPVNSYGLFTPLCRPAIGKTNDPSGSVLCLALNAATGVTSATSNTYYATYFMASYNGGGFWSTPEKITPTTPLRDYRYVSMSPTCSNDPNGFLWIAQMIVQVHDYSGTFSPNQPPGPSNFISMRKTFGGIRANQSELVSNNSPNNFSLKQNYPNPFNPSTVIRYSIPSNARRQMSNVKLIVYNNLGMEAATLIDESKPAGNYEIDFDGSGFSSGIYFYTLSSGDFIRTRKMILVK